MSKSTKLSKLAKLGRKKVVFIDQLTVGKMEVYGTGTKQLEADCSTRSGGDHQAHGPVGDGKEK